MIEIANKKNSKMIYFKKNRETEFKVELQHILKINSQKNILIHQLIYKKVLK